MPLGFETGRALAPSGVDAASRCGARLSRLCSYTRDLRVFAALAQREHRVVGRAYVGRCKRMRLRCSIAVDRQF
jgi:hypothetical protein